MAQAWINMPADLLTGLHHHQQQQDGCFSGGVLLLLLLQSLVTWALMWRGGVFIDSYKMQLQQPHAGANMLTVLWVLLSFSQVDKL